MDTLFCAILITFNYTFMEGALLIGDDDLSVFDERKLMFVRKQILVFDLFRVKVLNNKFLFIAILSFLFKRLLQYNNKPFHFKF